MKILLINNFYQSTAPSGEHVVYNSEKQLLKLFGQKSGYNLTVISFERSNDEISSLPFAKKILTSLNSTWSIETFKELRNTIRREKPDIAHFHNIFYLISPSAYYVCKDEGVKVIQTLHNFRLFCANSFFIRNGKICEECAKKSPLRGIIYGCNRNSRYNSIPGAITICLHRFLGTWIKKVDAFIALTEFSRKKFVEYGLSRNNIFIKPNFLLNPPIPKYTRSNYALFIGRLSMEKGVDTMIDAFEIIKHNMPNHFSLKIVGDGIKRKQLEDKIFSRKITNIELIGMKDHSECIGLIKDSKFLILPSIWYEFFPMVVLEAFACGKPVIASRLGSMAELIEEGKTGLLFEPGDPKNLALKIKWMIENEDVCIEMGKNARMVFEQKYTADKNIELLIDIYEKVKST